MISPNDNWGLQSTISHCFVYRPSKLCSFVRLLNPADKASVLGEHLHDHFVSFENVLLVARESSPPERPSTFTKKRADVFRHESSDKKRTFNSCIKRLFSNIVSVFEGYCASFLHLEHRPYVYRN